MLLAVWALSALTAAAKLPFIYNGTGLTVLKAQVSEKDSDTGTYRITINAKNDNTTIYDVNNGYYTTLRSYFAGGRSKPRSEENAMPLCAAIHHGCPVDPNSNFTFSFDASLGRRLQYMEDVHMFITISETNRSLGTIDMQLTREIGIWYQMGLGVIMPAGIVLAALLKYFLVIWLDPEPVSSWDPRIISNSGANELAAVGSAVQVFRYTQFIAFIAIVDVQYPAYFQSLLGRFGWVIGIYPNNWVSHLVPSIPGTDGLVSLAGSSQLESMIYFNQVPTVADLWPGNAITFGVILAIFICTIAVKWRSKYRWIHAISAVVYFWLSVAAVPLLFICFTSFLFLTPTAYSQSTEFYMADGDELIPNSLSEQLPYAFALSSLFHETHSNPGVVFSMALYITIWLAAVLYLGIQMYRARKKGYISRKNMMLWGRYIQSVSSDLWYYLLEIWLMIIQAVTFSVLSKKPLAQCVILLACQLVQIASLCGTTPAELSCVGMFLMMVPKVTALTTCCLLFPLCPEVIKNWPYLLKPYYSNRVMSGIIFVQVFVYLYFLVIVVLAMCVTIWRHFKFIPKSTSETAPMQPSSEAIQHSPYMATEVYYRKPRNQPEMEMIDDCENENEMLPRNYTTREVDYVYGINGGNSSSGTSELIPLKSGNKPEDKLSFMNKMFRPTKRPQTPGFEVIRRPDSRFGPPQDPSYFKPRTSRTRSLDS